MKREENDNKKINNILVLLYKLEIDQKEIDKNIQHIKKLVNELNLTYQLLNAL